MAEEVASVKRGISKQVVSLLNVDYFTSALIQSQSDLTASSGGSGGSENIKQQRSLHSNTPEANNELIRRNSTIDDELIRRNSTVSRIFIQIGPSLLTASI